MKTDKATVHLKEKPVGEATFKIYDSLEEAGADMGTATALKVLNTQVKTRAMNDFRKSFEPKETKTAIRNKAMLMITLDEFKSIQGDQARLDEVINKYVAQIENEKAAAEPPSKGQDEPTADEAADQAETENG